MSHLLPASDAAFDLGSSTRRWRDGYLSGNLTLSSLTAGSVLFAGSGGLISQDNANLFWDNVNKRLGIGTTNPGSRLEVRGSTSDNTASALNVTNSGGTSLLYVRNDGNVGIGTTSPQRRLHLSGDTYTSIRLDGTSGGQVILGTGSTEKWSMYTLNDILRFYWFGAGAGDKVVINSAGNVGIGTTSPAERLHVIGNVRIDDAYKLLWSDVNLYRMAADVLKTDDNLDALALRIGGSEVITSGRVLQNVSSLNQHLTPSLDNTYDLGSASVRFRYVYCMGVDVGDVRLRNGMTISEKDGKLTVKNPEGEVVLTIEEDGGIIVGA